MSDQLQDLPYPWVQQVQEMIDGVELHDATKFQREIEQLLKSHTTQEPQSL